MDRSGWALGISVVALGCSVAALVIQVRDSGIRRSDLAPVEALRSSAPEEAMDLTQLSSDRSTPDPVQAFQAQLLRNEEILRQLRAGELPKTTDE